jgi:GTP 3',8-cyclase
MFDRFDRYINYLRISITDRCNLRCTYCMPAEGVEMMNHSDILSFDEILDVVKVGVGFGINKVRITGGEPLVRKGVVSLIRMVSEIPGVKDLSMTTNGILLEKYAMELKNAGLHRVNISLDTLNPHRYKEITRLGDIEQVKSGIQSAILAGLDPIKINCVIKNSPDEPDARMVSEYGKTYGLDVRFIHEMELDKGIFHGVIGGDGGNCSICNRLRLTSNGFLKPCLFSNTGYSVRELGPKVAFDLALQNKPECGSFNSTGKFYNLGG